ncbi:hypothetical protein G7Y89_g1158 [Cudoniella acicularis]|uniref:RanBD1 domain-containing protein n=1 Tax=Cudoniella acicularis TaxID=354080 RepID=A0A8H4WAJ7_9HELO|nr:hypothetical protein G7Y89_g1158 [Cudoniella acicularis]
MRLLGTATLKLEEFSGNKIPPYAILSHTWEEKEVTFRDMQWDMAEKMVGYEKIKNTCSIAAACGFKYVWIDTCCIDKTSSAELSEAINSMFYWYREAEVCFAYLVDLPSHEPVKGHSLSGYKDSDFSKSRWFTRGWTLQELIAPSIVIFLNEKWQMIGTKSTLEQSISDITGISVGILSGDDLTNASVAQRMSWASKRETTRFEDLAYCLMGIFGIHMPLLYGEGKKAFIRLQEEIMKVSDDYSLFAWRLTPTQQPTRETHGELLATSPAAFIQSGSIVKLNPFNRFRNLGPLTVSNKGIHLRVPFVNMGDQMAFAILNCTEKGKDEDNMCFAIRVKDISLTKEYFERDQCEKLELLHVGSLQCPLRDICIKREHLTRKRKWGSDKEIREYAITKVMRKRRLLHEKTVEGSDEGDNEEGAVTDNEESRSVQSDKVVNVHAYNREAGEATLLQLRAKLLALESKEAGWKERGVGTLKINVPKSCVCYDDNSGSFGILGLEHEDADPNISQFGTARLIMHQYTTNRVILDTIITQAMTFEQKSAITHGQILFTAIEGKEELKVVNMLLKMSEANSKLFKSEVESIKQQL